MLFSRSIRPGSGAEKLWHQSHLIHMNKCIYSKRKTQTLRMYVLSPPVANPLIQAGLGCGSYRRGM
ncbi:hypothetical protein HMPREF1556_01425 [Porphyromonas sp. oral taxon 278 str. W7784]|nr:hypothetical protein HMPREF1556_01425 [Porphyromonas sp. oral taxon 278 str. W7784]